jgi:tetratricopeptide (TPR) repeat protein
MFTPNISHKEHQVREEHKGREGMRAFFSLVICFLLTSFPVQAQSPDGAGAQSLSAMENYLRGRDLEALNRISEANTHYNEAIRQCLDEVSRSAASRNTYTVLTWTMQRQRRYSEVITWGERGLRLFNDELRIVEIMGEAYFYLDDYTHSLAYMQRYTNALPQGDRASVAFFFTGEIYRITQRYHHADIAYTTALRFEPNLALWWYRLGSVREEIGDKTQAVDAYQHALRINPNYSEARNGIARLQGN